MNSDELLTWANECAETGAKGIKEWRDAIARLLAERDRLAAERDHHEQQQRLLLYRDMPKLRDERDAMFRAKCDAQARVAELERELAELRAACDCLVSQCAFVAQTTTGVLPPMLFIDSEQMVTSSVATSELTDAVRRIAALLARTPTTEAPR